MAGIVRGKLCQAGLHDEWRHTSQNWICCPCNREVQRRWKATHCEAVRVFDNEAVK